ncbi:MAG: hypothetical protein JW940_02550 [Polyangiaceae bacterium]|nr:hypothetical protein [Polyangiaceae bacterium]
MCLSHQGVRCGIPPRRILGASKGSGSEQVVCLWRRADSVQRGSPNAEERVFQLATIDGPRWIRGSNPTLCSVPAVDVCRLTPLLRELVPLPHVVGVAEIAGDLVWLVDPTRFSPVAAEVNISVESAV